MTIEAVKMLGGGIEDAFMWGFVAYMFWIGAKNKFEWVTSVRSLITMILILTFCDMAFDGRIDPKDFMLIVSLVMNFYFLAKHRQGETK